MLFVSHSWNDIVRLQPLVKQLNANGILTWFDQDEVHLADAIPAKMSDGLERAMSSLSDGQPAQTSHSTSGTSLTPSIFESLNRGRYCFFGSTTRRFQHSTRRGDTSTSGVSRRRLTR